MPHPLGKRVRHAEETWTNREVDEPILRHALLVGRSALRPYRCGEGHDASGSACLILRSTKRGAAHERYSDSLEFK
jgi:hypothetical protein